SYLLRQTYPASAGFVKLSNNNKTLIISVFDSTFNKPKSSYHILVDSGAVKLKDTDEPLFGIQDNVWNITTGTFDLKYYHISLLIKTFYIPDLGNGTIGSNKITRGKFTIIPYVL